MTYLYDLSAGFTFDSFGRRVFNFAIFGEFHLDQVHGDL